MPRRGDLPLFDMGRKYNGYKYQEGIIIMVDCHRIAWKVLGIS